MGTRQAFSQAWAVSYERGTPVRNNATRVPGKPFNRREPLPEILRCDSPHGGARTFQQKSTCLTQLTFRPYAVQIWSRNTLESGPNDALAGRRRVLVEVVED